MALSLKPQAPSRKLPIGTRFHMLLAGCRRQRISMRVFDVSLQGISATTLAVLLSGCSHAPPADFAPDPGLVAQIRDIRIVTSYARACPGSDDPDIPDLRSEEHT